jgi:hypothetical protein
VVPTIKSHGIDSEGPSPATRHKTILDQLIAHLEFRIDQLSIDRADSQSVRQIVSEQPFYIIKFQTFCKSEINPFKSSLDYNPYFVLAEVGLVEYSVHQGITNIYHAFIKPNEIPLGYRSQCMETERDVLGIPLNNFKEVTSTWAEIFLNICTFVKPQDSNNGYAPLFW